jgi:hypothetical protein
MIPLALALIGFWLTTWQHIRHQRIENQRAASKQAMEEEIVIENCDVRRMARARTLMVLESVQTPRIRPFVWVAERLLHHTSGKEDRLLWSSPSD